MATQDTDLFSFRQDWPALRQFFDVIGRIPADTQAFAARYGVFPDAASIRSFVDAVDTVNKIAAQVGGPSALRRKLANTPDYLFQANPPADIYAQLVWVASRAESAAQAFGSTFPLVESLLSPAMPVAQRAASLRRVLSGPGGLAATAALVAGQVQGVRGSLAPLTPQFNAALQTFHQTQVINQANVAIGELESSVTRLGTQAAEAREKAGSWLGKAKAEKELAELEQQIAAKNEELKRKQMLVDDTDALFTAGNRVVPALASIDEKLRILAKVFTDASDRLTTASQISSTDQLSDYKWLAGALDFPAAWQRWNGIQKQAQAFAQSATDDIGVAVNQSA